MRGTPRLSLFVLSLLIQIVSGEVLPSTSIHGLNNNGSNLEDVVLSLRIKFQEHAKEIAQLKVDYGQLWNDKESLRYDQNKLKYDNENMRKDNENLRKDTEKLRKDNEKLRKDNENLRKDTENLRKDNENLRNDNENLRKDTENLRNDTENLRNDTENLRNDTENLRNDFENLTEDHENLREDHENLREDYKNLRNDTENLRNNAKNLRNYTENLSEDSKNLRKDTENLRRDTENLRKDNENLKTSRQESILARDELKHQLNTMEGRLQYQEAISLQITPRTCQTLADLGVKRTGKYFIDPDGTLFGHAPIQVLCNMETDPVSTIVHHDSMGNTAVDNCADPGCYSRDVNYGSPMKQIVALIDQSVSCEQQIRYDCISAALETGDTKYGWWVDRHGQRHFYWHGSRAGEHVCKCGLARNCIGSNFLCNCDAGAPRWASDEGAITNGKALPVTKLRFGGLRLGSQKANFTLGGLNCRGKAPKPANPAESCLSLRQTGHSNSGYYLISTKEGRLHVVQCRMDLEHTDPNFQVETDARIARQGIYFDVFGAFGKENSVIQFDGTEVNIGGAMDPRKGIFTAPLEGIYAFHFHTWMYKTQLKIGIRKNGITKGRIWSDDKTAFSYYDHDQMPGQSVLLHLRKGETVDVFLIKGLLRSSEAEWIEEKGPLHSHFVGYLLYPM